MTTRWRAFTQRMKRQWGLLNAGNFTVSGVADANIVAVNALGQLETALGFQMHNVTASAVRYRIGYDILGDAGEVATIHCGLAWISLQAFVAGGAAIPRPDIDNYDWMAIHAATLVVPEGQAVGTKHLVELDLHSDSMRKQRENSSVLVLVWCMSLLTATSVQVHPTGRVLILGL